MNCKLFFKYGCMNGGKSLNLLSTAYNLEENDIQIMVLKPSLDTRDGEGVIRSRAGLERKCIMIDEDVNLYKAIKAYRNVLASQLETLKWVIVDEAQFLTEEQVDQLSDVVDFLDINVMCFGLRTDFQSHLFPGSKRLFEIADDLEEIKSSCECGEKKSSINARFDENGEIITEGSQVEIGGNDKYKAICRKCWKNKIRDKIMKDEASKNI
jgi:thymidine kinase